jgi:nucleotide-binding universal stress UspA family protein
MVVRIAGDRVGEAMEVNNMYERILVPLDGSELAENVLPYVQALAEKFGSAVTLLRATLPPEELVPPTGMGLPMGDAATFGSLLTPSSIDDFQALLDAEKEETKSYLEGVATRLKEAGVNVSAEQAEGAANDVIIRRAASLPASLVAMTTHGRSGLARVVVGSVADEVVRKAVCPVLLVRVSDKELKG